jgi:signal peptidase I
MHSELGLASRRGVWLAVALACLSALMGLMIPAAGLLKTVFWLAVALGIRRRQWWAALTGAIVMLWETGLVALRGTATAGVVVFGFSALVAAVCGYFFVRAALELRASDGKSRAAWPWIAWLCLSGVFYVCFEPYSMSSASMEKTLLRNESVLVEKAGIRLGRLPRPGELVVFHYPVDPKEVYIKRVAGIPGDRLKLVNKQLWRNGAAVPEPYAMHSTTYVDPYRDNFPSTPISTLPAQAMDMLQNHVQNGEVIVPAGKYFVLGDNRDDSLDSRYFGFVSASEIVGRPVLIYGSYDMESGKGMATAFNTRWNRLFRVP